MAATASPKHEVLHLHARTADTAHGPAWCRLDRASTGSARTVVGAPYQRFHCHSRRSCSSRIGRGRHIGYDAPSSRLSPLLASSAPASHWRTRFSAAARPSLPFLVSTRRTPAAREDAGHNGEMREGGGRENQWGPRFGGESRGPTEMEVERRNLEGHAK
jgi:hypothetical protein